MNGRKAVASGERAQRQKAKRRIRERRSENREQRSEIRDQKEEVYSGPFGFAEGKPSAVDSSREKEGKRFNTEAAESRAQRTRRRRKMEKRK